MTAQTTATADELLTAAQVRARFGNLSDMGLWKWLKNPNLNFPQPIRINNRRYWRAGDLDAFVEERQRATDQEAA